MGSAMKPEPIIPDSHLLIASDRVEGTEVRRPDGRKLGQIERLMIDKVSGRVAYAVLSFGGFLGIGEKHHAVAWDQLSYDPTLGAYELDLSETALEEAAEREAESVDWGERRTIVPVYSPRAYWGV